MLVSYVLLSQFLTNISLKNENIVKISNDEKVKMEYALVNEDLGADFEGKKYALGSDFVTLINQDSQNRWETTSRNIADAGIESGQFDAKIIIPQNFSANILSLQSIAPEKAMIEYQVREGQNAVSNQQIQEQVNLILRDFNQRVVQMYFSSVISNLSEAQLNVNEIIEEDSDSQTNLQTKIQTPFKELPSNFTTVLDTTSILSEENKIFDIEQKAFVNAVSELMESNNSELENQIQTTKTTKESIGSYTEEANKKIEESINQFNEQFELQKKQLVEQWDLDLTDYKGQYDVLNQSAINQLIRFSGIDENGTNVGLLPDLVTKTNQFEINQNKTKSDLNQSIESIEIEIGKLKGLQETIGETFFADLFSENGKNKKITILDKEDDVSKDIVRESVNSAIKNLINTNSSPNLDLEYFEVIKNNIKNIPLGDLKNLLSLSSFVSIIGPERKNSFEKEIAIIEKYALENNISAADDYIKFDYFKAELPREHNFVPEIKNTVTLNISLTNDTLINLKSINQSQTIHFDRLTDIKESIEIYLASKNFQSNSIIITDNSIFIEKPHVISSSPTPIGINKESTESTSEESIESSSEENTENVSEKSAESSSKESTINLPEINTKISSNELTVTFESYFKWMLNESEKAQQFNTINYGLEIAGINQFSSSYAIFDNFNLDVDLKSDIPKLLEQFEVLDTTTQQIVTLLGSPEKDNSTLSINAFYDFMIKPENAGETLTELSSKYSVYKLYNNNLDAEQFIVDSISDKFMSKGKEIYKSIDKSILKIIAVKESQEKIVEDMLPSDFFIKNIEDIISWHEHANLKINETYNSWRESNQVTPESIITSTNPHPELNDTKMIDSETESLIQSIETLVNTSKEASRLTTESAAKVKDIKPITEEVLTTTKEVQKKADTILVDLNSTVTKAQEDIEKNQLYAQSFSKVMANTKDGNADNTKVYDFLSSPISGNGVLGKTRQVSLIPYYATIIGMVLSIILSVALQRYMRGRKIKDNQLLINQSIIWRNIPNMIVILSSIIIFSIFYGLSIVTYVDTTVKISTFIYAILFFTSSSLLITGFMRFSRSVTLYICAIVLSIYFMLTPLIGVETKQGSLVNLLYKLSPLQNVQNGYTILINKVSLTWHYYVVFMCFIVVGVIINFISNPESTISKKGFLEEDWRLL